MHTFNLEQAIQNRNSNLQKQQGLEPGDIEELEAHLRDKIDALVAQGLSQEEAFYKASDDQFTNPDELADEFHHARSTKKTTPPWKARTWIPALLPNFLKITLRNFKRNKGYAFINIFGLAVGLACCLLIFLYVKSELSFDSFHTKENRIYRLVTDIQSPGGGPPAHGTGMGWPVGRTIKANYPEVQEMVYMRTYPTFSIKHDHKYFFDKQLFASQNFFQVFSFPLLQGNPKTALAQPNSIVLTQKMEKKYFGKESGMGQTLMLDDSLQFTITGIAKNIPKNSTIQFDMLLSFSTYTTWNPAVNKNQGWFNLNMFNYVLLKKGVNADAFRKKISNVYMANDGKEISNYGYTLTAELEPMEDIYLHSNRGNPMGPKSNIKYVYILSAIGLFILLIACINFMNLATARSMERAGEVGIRKAIGSVKSILIWQFFTESALTCFIALLIGLAITYLGLPYFNELTRKTFHFSAFINPQFLSFLPVVIIAIGLLAGLYPALVLSGFKPVDVLKRVHTGSKGSIALRKTLVVFQFAISCVLIISTIIVMRQLDFMQGQDLGFNKDQIVVMDVRQAPGQTRTKQYRTIKQTLLKHPEIESVTATNAPPGRTGWNGQVAYAEGDSPEQSLSTELIAVDYDFVKTTGLKIIAGRDFSRDHATDADDGLIINETAVKAFGWKSPEDAVSKRILSPSHFPQGTVIGVIKDYHQHGLQQKIKPEVLDINPDALGYFAIRFDPSKTSVVLADMKLTWKTFFPGYSFDYFFLDQDFARQYKDQQRLVKIFGAFSVLAILIGCLGLFGLAAFAAQKRTKEIGIRKILGASVPSLFGLLSKDFLKLVLFAFIISVPIAWYAMHQWLQDFAYHIQVGVGPFLLAGMLAILITLLTVSWQTLKAAFINPVKSLRSE